jgi:hypothetical protein
MFFFLGSRRQHLYSQEFCYFLCRRVTLAVESLLQLVRDYLSVAIDDAMMMIEEEKR